MKPKVGEVWIFGNNYTLLRGRKLIVTEVTSIDVTFTFNGATAPEGVNCNLSTHPINAFLNNHYRSESDTIREILTKYE